MRQSKTLRYVKYPFVVFSFSTFLLMIADIILAASQTPSAFGSSSSSSSSPTSQYDSGFEHGCDDAMIPELLDRYINQPGNGPSDQTDEFMREYDAGFNVCLDRASLGSVQQ
jgi:hypothetical protein